MDLTAMICWAAGLILAIVLFGRFGQQIKHVFGTLFGVFRFDEFIQQTLFCLQQIMGGTASFIRDAVAPRVPEEERRRHLDQIVGTAILTGCTFAIVSFMFVLNAATFEVLFQLPKFGSFGAVAWLAPLADAGIFVANGLILCDLLGWTHILPPFPESARTWVRVAVVASFIGGLYAVVTLNDWRLNNLESPRASSQAISAPESDVTFGPAITPNSASTKVQSEARSRTSDFAATRRSEGPQLPTYGVGALMIACLLTTLC